jgi:hypothetical protein
MKRAFVLALPFLFASVTAFAAQSSGNGALALAAQIGAEDPSLSTQQKSVLTYFLNSQTSVTLPSGVRTITVKADKISCRMGDVDIGLHACTLTFGSRTVTKSGTAGQMFLATMQENGVPSDGSAGTIFYNATAVSCTIDATQVESHDGGGAACTFTSN